MHIRFITFLFVLMLLATYSMHAQTVPTELSAEKEKATQEMQKKCARIA